jgi:thiol-disulfide isomerase/thioredoxin
MSDHDIGRSPSAISRRSLLTGIGGAGVATLSGCLGSGGGGAGAADAGADRGAWQSIELEAVRSGETFTIAELEAPTIVHSFAVWCPKCKALSNQLAAIADTHTILGLNTDPNEDAEKVRGYAVDSGYDWRFAVAPTELTDALISAFGSTVANAPSTPVIVVCEDGTATFLSGGDSTRDNIRATAEEC